MTTATLAIDYASTAVTDPWWVRFGQDGVSDTATVGETADLLDVLYTIDPCDGSESEVSEPVAEDVVDAVVQTFRLSICDKRYDGSVLVPIKIYRSHPSDDYVLRVSGGRVEGESVAIAEEVTQIATVKQASSLTLEYPVVSGFTARWVGDVVGPDGNHVSPPTIKRQGNTLYWQGQVTGTVRAEFVSTHDRIGILVAGVDGEMGQAVVRAFYHGTCTTFTPEMPDAAESDTSLCPSTTWQVDPDPDNVTCYEIVVQTKRCGCSGIEKESQTFERDVPCPASGPTRCPGVSHTCRHLLGTVPEEVFVECEEDQGYLVAEREFYKEQCCEYPSLSLPQCEEKTESYAGDKSIEHGEAFWRGLYGEHTRFVPISPEDGCGKHITRQVVQPDDCCETAPKMTWNSDSSIDTVHDFDSGFVYVRDGIGPFVWRITGDGYLWFSGSATPAVIVTEERWAAIETGAYPCGKFEIEVTDACGTVVSGEIVSTYGAWVLRYNTAAASERWDIADLSGLPVSNPTSWGFEEIGWAGAEAIAVAVYVIVGEGSTRVKYMQPSACDTKPGSATICAGDTGLCSVIPGDYGLSFTLPAVGEGGEVLGDCGRPLVSEDHDWRSRIYDPSWEAIVANVGPAIGCVPSGIVTTSGDFVLTVSRLAAPTSECPSGYQCYAEVWIKAFAHLVTIYDWSC